MTKERLEQLLESLECHTASGKSLLSADSPEVEELIRISKLGLIFEEILKERAALEAYIQKYCVPMAENAARLRDATILEALKELPDAAR